MIKKFRKDFKFINNYHDILVALNSDNISEFDKIIIDNFDILLHAFSFIEKQGYKLKSDRVFYFLKDVVNKNKFNVAFKELMGFLNQYQKDIKSYLSYEEVYSIKVILICIYVFKLSELCLNEANRLNNKLAIDKINAFENLESLVIENQYNPHFLFLLYKKIQYNNALFRKFIPSLHKNKISLHEVLETEKDYYINHNHIAMHIIEGICSILHYKEIDILNQICKVEKELLKRSYYKNMTVDSKNIYRSKLIKFCQLKKYDLLDFVKKNKSNIELDIPLQKYLPVLDYKHSLKIPFFNVVVTYIKEVNFSKVDLALEKFEEYYRACNSKNIYYTLVCDKTCGSDVKKYILSCISKLNDKYNTRLFHFICINRNINQELFMLDYLNKLFLNKLEKHKNVFIENSFSDCKVKFKYLIFNDLNKGIDANHMLELIGAISHPLNKKYTVITYKNRRLFSKTKNYIYDIVHFHTILSLVSFDDKWVKSNLVKNGLKIGYFKELGEVNDRGEIDQNTVFPHSFLDAMIPSSTNKFDTIALSNGNYTVLLDSFGRSVSKYRSIRLTPYRENGILYIRDVQTNCIWMNSCFHTQDKCNYTFCKDRAKFVREDSDIKIETDIVVSKGYDLEIKKITITNKTSLSKVLELTTYYDFLLADNKLFINSSYDERLNVLLSNKCGKNNYFFHKLLLSNQLNAFSYTTDKSSLFDAKGNMNTLESLDNKLENNLDKIMSFRNRISIDKGEGVSVYLISGYARSLEQVRNSIQYYNSIKNIEEEYKITSIYHALSLDCLNISIGKERDYNSFIKFLVNRNNYAVSCYDYDILRRNSLSKSSLMKYRLDTLYSIVLLEIKDVDHIQLLYDFLKMYEYFLSKSIFIRLIVIVDCLKFNYIKTSIDNEVYRIHRIYNSYKKSSSVLILNSKRLSREEKNLFYTLADIRVDCDKYLDFFAVLEDLDKIVDCDHDISHTFLRKSCLHEENLLFDNSYGGFSKYLDSYIIYNNYTPRAWSNILSNETFGSIVTNHGYSYTYFDNPSEFRLTDLYSNTSYDHLSEGFLFNHSLFEPNRCSHGFGYTILEGSSDTLHVSITQFVPISDSVKVCVLDISNTLNKKQDVLVNYFIHPILGSSSDDYKYVLPDVDLENNLLKMRNVVQLNYKDVYTFLSCSHKIDAYHINHISRKSIDTHILLQKKESIKMIFVLGCSKDEDSLKGIVEKYCDLDNVDFAFNKLKLFWSKRLSLIDVHTSDTQFNIMTKWSLYQEISNRYLYAHYYGYQGISNCRENLLSALNLLIINEEELKRQILLSAAHQFIKGDILYWFYDKNKFGLRNKSFDTHLIFAYSVLEYISTTLDYDILDEKVPYIYGDDIGHYEKEKIVVFRSTFEKYTLLDHLIKAIDLSLSLVGSHHIPLMDQNDFDGIITNCCFKGESMIVGFMLYSVLSKFIDAVQLYDHIDIKYYERCKLNLRKILNSVGFVDDHYVRCLCDNGDIIGNDCAIDLLTQSFSILSGVLLKKNVSKVLKRVDRDLYDPSRDILKYISTPFPTNLNDLGKISSYPAGYFENGGASIQTTLFYVHSLLKLGKGDQAGKYLHGISPLNRNIHDYKIEPYFIGNYIDCSKEGFLSNDYTPGLFYNTLIQGFLGFHKVGKFLTITPKVSHDFSIVYHYLDTVYSIDVKFGNCCKYSIDGCDFYNHEIELVNDKKSHHVEIFVKRK